jgi:hypothetical protein
MRLRIIIPLFYLFSNCTFAQSNLTRFAGELEFGGGPFYWTYDDGLFNGAVVGFQTQLDYDFIEGPLRAAVGFNTQSVFGYTYLRPSIKLGKDLVNVNVSADLDGLTYYGLSSRINMGLDNKHALNLAIQVAYDYYTYDRYTSSYLGYSYRL